MSVDEMIAVLNDPGQKLGWKGAPAGLETEEQVREWAFGLFAGWETEHQVSHLLEVGAEEAADILSMAAESDKAKLLSLLPPDFRVRVETLLPVRGP
ncbi:MAG: hypothetical protein OXN93_00280 [bacterium]|nr:hypothetical protein [bacterium]